MISTTFIDEKWAFQPMVETRRLYDGHSDHLYCTSGHLQATYQFRQAGQTSDPKNRKCSE